MMSRSVMLGEVVGMVVSTSFPVHKKLPLHLGEKTSEIEIILAVRMEF